MKTDILDKITNSDEYIEELIYNLNGQFPHIVFKRDETVEEDYRILISDKSFFETDEYLHSVDDFLERFPWYNMWFNHEKYA